MSKNDSIKYKQTHQALVIYGVDETEHNNNSFQSTAPLVLEKGKYYYYEFRHKENGWRDHFNLFWKPPFTNAKSGNVSQIFIYTIINAKLPASQRVHSAMTAIL